MVDIVLIRRGKLDDARFFLQMEDFLRMLEDETRGAN
jgi:hypothetical protein